MHFSPLGQINADNVSRLRRAWTYHTGELGRAFEVTPTGVRAAEYRTGHDEGEGQSITIATATSGA
jgi:hypothetical protein